MGAPSGSIPGAALAATALSPCSAAASARSTTTGVVLALALAGAEALGGLLATGLLVGDVAVHVEDEGGTMSGPELAGGAPTEPLADTPTGPGHWLLLPQASGTPSATSTRIAEGRGRGRMREFYQNLRCDVAEDS